MKDIRAVPSAEGSRAFFLCRSIWKSTPWGPRLVSLCKCKRTEGITALVLSKQKTCHLSSRFIDSVRPISSNGYHREWLGETRSHNEAQIITTSPKFARALSLSTNTPPPQTPKLQARQAVSFCSIKGIRQRRKNLKTEEEMKRTLVSELSVRLGKMSDEGVTVINHISTDQSVHVGHFTLSCFPCF